VTADTDSMLGHNLLQFWRTPSPILAYSSSATLQMLLRLEYLFACPRKLLGNSVHAMIDLPYHWLGRSHRKLFHSYGEAMLIGAWVAKGDAKGAIAGLLHVLADEAGSRNPETKRILEALARFDSKVNRPARSRSRRRRNRRRTQAYPWQLRP